MSVQVSQLNRAVSTAALEVVVTVRRFTATDLFALPGGANEIDGTRVPFTSTTDSGWWGTDISNANGELSEPATLTYTGRLSAYLFTLVGISGNYPVDFVLRLYKDRTLLKTVTQYNNNEEYCEITLDKAYDIDSYVLEITKISVANDVLKVSTASFGSHISSLMKEPHRAIHGRVEVAYNNFIQDTTVEVSEGAHGSFGAQLTNGSHTPSSSKFFKLYDNDLSGDYVVGSETSEIGWWPKSMPNASGIYSVPPTLRLQFSQRSLYGLSIYFDALNNDYAVNFTIKCVDINGDELTENVTNNTSAVYTTDTVFADVVELNIIVQKTKNASRPVVFTDVPIESVVSYYDKDLIDMSLLEELTYEDAMEKLGAISANELTVTFNNANKDFYFNNTESNVAGYLKKNKRVKAWLGVEAPNGAGILWSILGTFWTYSWNVPVGSLTANMVAFDTIGLLGTRPFYDHQVYRNESIGDLLDIVLDSAKESLPFLTWTIDDDLYDIIIPVAWFENSSYAAALNRLASCDLFHIYCARDGGIVAAKRLSGILSPDDVWTNETNIYSTSYPTLHTAPPNYINVNVTSITSTNEEVINLSGLSSSVTSGEVRTYTFDKPVEDITSITITTTATYTYEAYSWGIVVTFTSNGTLSSISVTADTIDATQNNAVLLKDAESIAENGIVSCDITSDFIQTVEHASRIAEYMYDRASDSIYDAEVEYRGDIMLTLNDIIDLPDGIAPTNTYFIKRHELTWNGSLRGSARLNT